MHVFCKDSNISKYLFFLIFLEILNFCKSSKVYNLYITHISARNAISTPLDVNEKVQCMYNFLYC